MDEFTVFGRQIKGLKLKIPKNTGEISKFNGLTISTMTISLFLRTHPSWY